MNFTQDPHAEVLRADASAGFTIRDSSSLAKPNLLGQKSEPYWYLCTNKLQHLTLLLPQEIHRYFFQIHPTTRFLVQIRCEVKYTELNVLRNSMTSSGLKRCEQSGL